MPLFSAADILIPRPEASVSGLPAVPLETWSVIACDQFTSQPEYWRETRRLVGTAPSTLNLILPEAELNSSSENAAVRQIHHTMTQYLDEDIFETYQNAFIYVERTLQNGRIRKGLIGKVDLEAYDYRVGSVSPIRATEKTVLDRIPPREQVRQGASLETPHILMLCDDEKKRLIEPIADGKDHLSKLYDFDLMQGGGHISGYLVQDQTASAFSDRFEAYVSEMEEKEAGLTEAPVILAVGDGNHSLAAAKACYEKEKAAHPEKDFSNDPVRYALVELNNIHEESLVFKPIHRLVTDVDVQDILANLQESCGLSVTGGHCIAEADDRCSVTWYAGTQSGTIYLDVDNNAIVVGVLQNFLDTYLDTHPGNVDYIHGHKALRTLAKQANVVGFQLPTIQKKDLFPGVIKNGTFPQKTFSMGHAKDKRYYLEARAI